MFLADLMEAFTLRCGGVFAYVLRSVNGIEFERVKHVSVWVCNVKASRYIYDSESVVFGLITRWSYDIEHMDRYLGVNL